MTEDQSILDNLLAKLKPEQTRPMYAQSTDQLISVTLEEYTTNNTLPSPEVVNVLLTLRKLGEPYA